MFTIGIKPLVFMMLPDNCQYIVDGKSCHDIVDSRIVFIDS